MKIEGLTQKEIVAAQYGALSRLGDERTYAQDMLYDKVRREHLANVHTEGLESVYACRPFTEHSKQVMRNKAVSFMANVYGVEL
jgi:ethanolamine ammonia-lyase small subunit